VKALDDSQLKNWKNYLDFEEKESGAEKCIDLYERCLIPCALYEEFWIRYVRYLTRKEMIEEARQVFTRAFSGFLTKKFAFSFLHFSSFIFLLSFFFFCFLFFYLLCFALLCFALLCFALLCFAFLCLSSNFLPCETVPSR